jgi:hypothetical protein
MSYIIYNVKTTLLWGGKLRPNTYRTVAAAKAAMTRAYRNGIMKSRMEWKIEDASVFASKIEKTETKTNLLSGKSFTQNVNTPSCCDPSSETYWSM